MSKNKSNTTPPTTMYLNGQFSVWTGNGRKPKGWYSRYEIKWVDMDLSGPPEYWRGPYWNVTHCIGGRRSPNCWGGLREVRASLEIDDVILLRRAGAHDVWVPVLIIRPATDDGGAK